MALHENCEGSTGCCENIFFLLLSHKLLAPRCFAASLSMLIWPLLCQWGNTRGLAPDGSEWVLHSPAG